MGLEITKSIKGFTMSEVEKAEIILNLIEEELGENWDDSTDIFERVVA